MSTPAPLTPLEIASGIVTGGTVHPLPALAAGVAPGEALVAAIEPAAEEGQLFVSFSGGMDSSLILAAATRAAANVGSAPPVPLTWRPEDAPAAREDDWQEAVVLELGLPDWERLTVGDELDWIGPVAQRVIARHGLLAPPNTHLHDPLLERAAGGTLLTGIGGDQILGTWRWGRVAAARAGQLPRTPRRRIGSAVARLPVGVLAAIEATRRARQGDGLTSGWLTPAAARDAHRAAWRQHVGEPQSWPERLAWQAGRRALLLGLDALEAMALHHGARIAHPLLDPAVLAAVAQAGGPAGFPSRRAALASGFRGLVPAAVADRRTKATFGEVFERAPSRAFIERWDRWGVDPRLVDATGLAEAWATGVSMRTAMLLQQLACSPGGGSSATRQQGT